MKNLEQAKRAVKNLEQAKRAVDLLGETEIQRLGVYLSHRFRKLVGIRKVRRPFPPNGRQLFFEFTAKKTKSPVTAE